MTTFTMRYVNGHCCGGTQHLSDAVQDARRARDWCKAHYPGSPITEIGRASSKTQGMILSPDDPLAKGAPRRRPRK